MLIATGTVSEVMVSPQQQQHRDWFVFVSYGRVVNGLEYDLIFTSRTRINLSGMNGRGRARRTRQRGYVQWSLEQTFLCNPYVLVTYARN
jgi:hypothetical protein